MADKALSEADAKLVAGFISAIRGESPPETKMPCEVTVCMPVYNAIFTVQKSLRSCWFSRQGIPLNVFAVENASNEGTQDFMRGLMKPSVTRDTWLTLSKWRELRVFELPQAEGHAWRFPREFYNLRSCFRLMFAKAQTEYVLTLDADVDAPAGGVRTLLEALKADDKLGIVGIKYDDNVTHVKHGFSLMRAKDARRWAARLQTHDCMCSQWCKMAEDEGYKCVNLPGLTARHRRNENE